MIFLISCPRWTDGEPCPGHLDGKTADGQPCPDCLAGRVSCHTCGYVARGGSLMLACAALGIPEPPENVKIRREEKRRAAEARRAERLARS